LLRLFAPLGKSANDLRLAIAANIAVAGERRHDVIMPKVLRPTPCISPVFCKFGPPEEPRSF
jgi:hypothetical protein